MRTGGHTFGYFIQLYPSYNFQLQHEELAEVEQGGAGAELGLDSEEFCDGTHPNMVLAGLDVLCRENTFTHVRIKMEEAEFPVHKCVLSSLSPCFVLEHIQERFKCGRRSNENHQEAKIWRVSEKCYEDRLKMFPFPAVCLPCAWLRPRWCRCWW